MREGLRLVEDRGIEEISKIEALRATVKLGEQTIARGEYKDFDDTQAMVDYLDNLAARLPRRSKAK